MWGQQLGASGAGITSGFGSPAWGGAVPRELGWVRRQGAGGCRVRQVTESTLKARKKPPAASTEHRGLCLLCEALGVLQRAS